jgi:hypothetical protein
VWHCARFILPEEEGMNRTVHVPGGLVVDNRGLCDLGKAALIHHARQLAVGLAPSARVNARSIDAHLRRLE